MRNLVTDLSIRVEHEINLTKGLKITHCACFSDLHVLCGCFLCQHFKINISFKGGKIKIYQYFDYSVLEKMSQLKNLKR